MRAELRRVPWVLALLVVTGLVAAEVKPLVRDGRVDLSLLDIPLPQTLLEKDLPSGIPTTLVVAAVAHRGGAVVAEARWKLTARYDLWDEVWYLEVTGSGTTRKWKATTLAAALGELRRPTLPALAPFSAVRGEQPVVIDVTVLLNPVSKERAERARQWIAANSIPLAPSADFAGARSDAAGGLRFQSLFQRILEDHFDASGIGHQWKLRSAPWRPGRVP